MHCKHSEAAHAQCHTRSHSGGGRGHKDLRSTHWSYSIFPLVQSTAVDKPTNGYLFTLFHEEKALYSCTSPPFSPQQPAHWQALHSKLFRFSAQWRSQSDIVMTQRTDAQFTELHQCWGGGGQHGEETQAARLQPTSCTQCVSPSNLISTTGSPPVLWRRGRLHSWAQALRKSGARFSRLNCPHRPWPSAVHTLGPITKEADYSSTGSVNGRHSLPAAKPSSGKWPTHNSQPHSQT